MSDRPSEQRPPVDDDAVQRAAAGGPDVADGGDLPHPAGGASVDEVADDASASEEIEASDDLGESVDDDPGAQPERNADGSAEEPDARTRDELLEALNEAERQRDEYLDDLRRSQAEFQNYRKRAMREGSQQRVQGATEVLSKIVEVVDDFELAVIAAESSQDVESLRKGVEMVYGKLVDVLRAFGMEKIGKEGATFDPERHDAVQQIDDGEQRDEPIVVEVLRPGYMVGDRVLRPAMVKVAR